jgi:hypothetical protein
VIATNAIRLSRPPLWPENAQANEFGMTTSSSDVEALAQKLRANGATLDSLRNVVAWQRSEARRHEQEVKGEPRTRRLDADHQRVARRLRLESEKLSAAIRCLEGQSR